MLFNTRDIVIVLWDWEIKEDSESSVDLEAAFLKEKALKKGDVKKKLDIGFSSAPSWAAHFKACLNMEE